MTACRRVVSVFCAESPLLGSFFNEIRYQPVQDTHTGRGLLARLGAGMCIPRNVLVKCVHKLPASFFTPQLQPTRHIKKSCSGRVWIWHHDMALINRFSQIVPRFWHRQAMIFRFNSIETDRGDPGPLTNPQWRVHSRVDVFGVQHFNIFRRISLKVSFIS